jgi:hypothetical protein
MAALGEDASRGVRWDDVIFASQVVEQQGVHESVPRAHLLEKGNASRMVEERNGVPRNLPGTHQQQPQDEVMKSVEPAESGEGDQTSCSTPLRRGHKIVERTSVQNGASIRPYGEEYEDPR